MSSLKVSWVRPVVATRQKGTIVGDAHMSDYRTIRFRILRRDPVTVRAVTPGAGPAEEAAIKDWVRHARQPEPVA